MELLGDALQFHAIRLGHARGVADLANVTGQLDKGARVDAGGVVLRDVLLLADDDALRVQPIPPVAWDALQDYLDGRTTG
ncbi:hypothetical protein [Streptomyces pilosus]|uniref:Uncharacterized protein n=1 Tax=Streptomyces pilosus TaxID=28893 RepID=A0A918F3U6_9ACTN|nr:hypothetical protein [Streptomyces pilosus]GGR04901.1 hypothetical protein GCM10010280_61180 [Streptomyces pilosus]